MYRKTTFTLTTKLKEHFYRTLHNENSRKTFRDYRWWLWFRAATAEYLVKQGASVTLVDMNVEAGEQQAKQLGPKADFVKLDVTDEAAAEQFFKDVLAKHGHLYGLVNCAGIGPSAKVVGREGVHDLGLFAKTLNINVTGTFNMLRFAADAMSKTRLKKVKRTVASL